MRFLLSLRMKTYFSRMSWSDWVDEPLVWKQGWRGLKELEAITQARLTPGLWKHMGELLMFLTTFYARSWADIQSSWRKIRTGDFVEAHSFVHEIISKIKSFTSGQISFSHFLFNKLTEQSKRAWGRMAGVLRRTDKWEPQLETWGSHG